MTVAAPPAGIPDPAPSPEPPAAEIPPVTESPAVPQTPETTEPETPKNPVTDFKDQTAPPTESGKPEIFQPTPTDPIIPEDVLSSTEKQEAADLQSTAKSGILSLLRQLLYECQ